MSHRTLPDGMNGILFDVAVLVQFVDEIGQNCVGWRLLPPDVEADCEDRHAVVGERKALKTSTNSTNASEEGPQIRLVCLLVPDGDSVIIDVKLHDEVQTEVGNELKFKRNTPTGANFHRL